MITEEEERDTILSLLVAAAVAKTWNPEPAGQGRGHNIGALLVDKKCQPVAFARNEASSRRDLTAHAELRLMRGYIQADPERTELHKHSIYTTLEPCVMCAGMMLMTNIRRTVYLQPDPFFGGVFERLAEPPSPYPKSLESTVAPSSVGADFEAARADAAETELIHWLPTEAAKAAYESAAERFSALSTQHGANQGILNAARDFLSAKVG